MLVPDPTYFRPHSFQTTHDWQFAKKMAVQIQDTIHGLIDGNTFKKNPSASAKALI
jgi:hypothetical protein